MKKSMKSLLLVWSVIIWITFWAMVFGMWSLFHNKTQNTPTPQVLGETVEAYFAGGCFWCMEWIFEWQAWVKKAVSGYIGWTAQTATYGEVSTGQTKHREAVRVVYDPQIISYEKLVELFWTQIDPTDAGGQFADRGFHYTTAIYYSNEEERTLAEASKKALADSGKFDEEIATLILPAEPFYDAEEYHQDYYKKSSLRYNLYKKGSGRAGFIDDNWKDRIAELNESTYSDAALRERLTPLQYKVTQQGGTERPFKNEYWDNKEAGIYVDIIDGSPLYSSLDKYKSGTGWPSFTRPISPEVVTEHEDNTLFSTRTEIKSASSGAHLGHVFNDGPADKGGLRYCMNSASMRFIPVDKLEEEGYEKYLELFQ